MTNFINLNNLDDSARAQLEIVNTEKEDPFVDTQTGTEFSEKDILNPEEIRRFIKDHSGYTDRYWNHSSVHELLEKHVPDY